VTGPAADEGPAFETVTVALPVPPGAIEGVLIVVLRSAEPAPTVTVGEPDELVAFRSVPLVATDIEPPLRVEAGFAVGSTDKGTAIAAVAPLARSPLITQLIGPLGIGPVQPAGSAVMEAPLGGEYETV
jgi:hypothetical protein